MHNLSRFIKITLLIFLTTQSVSAGTIDFIKRGFTHCTGFCEANHINCNPYENRQSYYKWCKKNCTHQSKNNRDAFTRAIALCEGNKYQCKVIELNQKDYVLENQNYHLAACSNSYLKTVRIPLFNTTSDVQKLKIGDIIYFNSYKNIDTSTTEQKQEYDRQRRQGYRPDFELPDYDYATGPIFKG